jgi:hypothetical protein
MADTGAFADITAELKNAYPPGSFEEPVNKETFYRKSLTRVELTESEGIATFPLGIASAWNVSMIADVGTLPSPIDPTRVQVTPELFSGSFQIGVVTKSAAKSNRGTFSGGGIYSDRVETTTEDLGKYINKVYCGSHYGRLGVIATDDGANTFTLDDPLRALPPADRCARRRTGRSSPRSTRTPASASMTDRTTARWPPATTCSSTAPTAAPSGPCR